MASLTGIPPRRQHRVEVAAAALVPSAAWVTFAGALTWTIAARN